MSLPVSPKRIELIAAARQRILLLDGAMGTMIQALGFDEAAFRGARFANFHRDLRGNNDLLILTQPQAIEDIHAAYLRAGADIVATNTFSSTSIAQADYDLADIVYEMNREGARLVLPGPVGTARLADLDLGDAAQAVERHLAETAAEGAVEADPLGLVDPEGAIRQQLDPDVEPFPGEAARVLGRGRRGPGGQPDQQCDEGAERKTDHEEL